MASKLMHAPGSDLRPWRVEKHSWQDTSVSVAGDPSLTICRLDITDWGVTEENQTALEVEQAKVAALIAAAPELLRAAKIVLASLNARIDATLGRHVPAFAGIAALRDAINKAEPPDAP